MTQDEQGRARTTEVLGAKLPSELTQMGDTQTLTSLEAQEKAVWESHPDGSRETWERSHLSGATELFLDESSSRPSQV